MQSILEREAKCLVDISKIIPDICLDIRYATANNFMGYPLYSSPLCYLHEDTAVALCKVQAELSTLSLGLKIYDGYRPLPVQQAMWDAIQDDRFVSNPAVRIGGHIRGIAVDVTLIDRDGEELEMPSGFDEFNEKAYSSYMGASAAALSNRSLLHAVMTKHGFSTIDTEWWHFDLNGGYDDAKYPPLNITFEALESIHT